MSGGILRWKRSSGILVCQYISPNSTDLTQFKIGDALIQHMLCKQESGLAEILSHLPQYIFCRFENQRMRRNMFPFDPQVLHFKNM